MDNQINTVEGISLIKKLVSKWYWFVLSLLVVGGAAVFLYLRQPVIYEIKGTIIVNEERQQGGQLPEETMLTGLAFNQRGSLNRQMQILKSRYLMEKVVDSLNLDIGYYAEGRFRKYELYKNAPVKVDYVTQKPNLWGEELRVKQLEGNRFALIVEEQDTFYYNYGVPFVYNNSTIVLERDTLFPPEERVLSIEFYKPRDVATMYSGALLLRKLAQSNVLSISIEDETPQKIKDIIHYLVLAYNLDAQEEKNRMANRSLDFIDERLREAASRLGAVESRQASIKSSASVASDFSISSKQSFDRLSAIEQSEQQILQARNVLDKIESFLNTQDGQYDLIPDFGDMGGISFASLVRKYNQVVAARKRLMRTATEQHPEAIESAKQLASLKNNILKSVSIARQDLNRQRAELVGKASEVQSKIKAIPFVEKAVKDKSRQADVQGELFSYLLQKREETAIGLAANVESVRILDEPVESTFAVAPSKRQYAIMAFLLALLLPASVVYLQEKLNDKIGTSEQVKEYAMEVPFLGEVAQAKDNKSLVNDNSRNVVAEMFRIIRTNLQFMATGIKHKTILVSSYISGDGKTFVSGNLAACLSLTGKKTIVLELDLRRPMLTKLIKKEEPSSGITNYLVGEKEIEDIIQKVDGYKSFYLISSGPAPPNPAELIMSDRMEQLMKYLKDNFDYIVIDSPPVGLVTDAFLLNKFTNNTIFVVRANKTKKSEL
ncbi:MAG TPA: polysaccharide biosynthesis tyrosine autokinase, partial [Bacteroidetes bacterium]|nr:polysaccharide biosynthesis tyrosine autokinase [Bacteroidota bacterium]